MNVVNFCETVMARRWASGRRIILTQWIL